LQVTIEDAAVELSWENPSVDDFSYVRVVRNNFFYPSDPLDGYVVYQGKAEMIQDRDAFTQFDEQFYTVFSYDTNGNISSGAVVYVTETQGQSLPPKTTTPPAPAASSAAGPMFAIDLSDILVIQGGIDQNQGEVITISDAQPITFSIPYQQLPEHLKTVTVTLVRTRDNSEFTFLLRVNKNRSAYEATVAPLGEVGEYRVELVVFDFQRYTLATATGTIEVQPGTVAAPGLPISDTFRLFWYVVFTLGLLLLLWLLRLVYRRIRGDN